MCVPESLNACATLRAALIASRYQNVYGGRATTEEECAGLLIAVLFAGQHTSSVTTAWTGLFMTDTKVGGW